MARAGKIIAHHRHGKGLISARSLTVARAGGIGDTGFTRAEADTFVDPFPQVSLAGMDPNRLIDRRGNVMGVDDESHIQRRTRGKRGGARGRIVQSETYRDGE